MKAAASVVPIGACRGGTTSRPPGGAKILYEGRFAMRFHHLLPAIILVLAAAGAAPRDLGAAEVFTVRGVPVDVTAETAAAARETAHAQGQAEAFGRLLARLLPAAELPRVPPLEPAQVVEYVSDFEVAEERTSDVRYLASMTVRFNANAVRRFLADNELTHAETQSKPVVVVPVYGPAELARIWEDGNPWWSAWAARPTGAGLVPLIVPLGDLADIGTLNAGQALAGDMAALGRLAARYGAEDVLITQAVLHGEPELGPVAIQVGTSRLGRRQQSTTIETFTQAEDEDLAALYDRAVTAVAEGVQEDWKQRNLLRPGLAQRITVAVPIAGLDEWLKIRRRLEGVAGVQRSDIVALSRAQSEIDISFVGDEQQLVLAMAQSDLDLSFDESEGWRLRLAGAVEATPNPPASE